MTAHAGAWGRRLLAEPVRGAGLVLAGAAAVLGQAAVVSGVLLVVAVLGALAADRAAGAGSERGRVLDPVLGTTLWGLVVLLHGVGEWPPGVLRVVAAALAVLVCLVAVTSAVDGELDGLHRHPAARGLPGVGAVPLVRRPSALLLPLLPQVCLLVPAVLVSHRPVLVAVAAGVGLLAAAAVVLRWA